MIAPKSRFRGSSSDFVSLCWEEALEAGRLWGGVGGQWHLSGKGVERVGVRAAQET